MSTSNNSTGSQLPVATKAFDQNDIDDNKVIAALSYLGLLFLVPLLARPNSKFCRAHVNQGIVFFIVFAVTSIVLMILSLIPLLGFIFWIVMFLFCLVSAIIAIVQIIFCLKGEYKKIPILGNLNIIK
ncbi:MAG: DUF4870 domain-containing protein [Deltaproteobacteria bacterium]|jgi:uncharacterized membrane protein|nr:DUF4870 domain-containing protein [Deltaproteobacteria bacterium]